MSFKFRERYSQSFRERVVVFIELSYKMLGGNQKDYELSWIIKGKFFFRVRD